MTIKSGTHAIGPENGTLTINTYVGGMGSKMGHDLVLEATRWQGSLDVDVDDPGVSAAHVVIDARSLQVVRATGGLKPLSDSDRADIAQNQAKTLQSDVHPEITFDSTSVTGAPPRLSLLGNLTIKGTTRPVTLDIAVEDGDTTASLTAATAIAQTDFGIKPYSKLGALKVKDVVEVQVRVTLPTG